MPDSQQAAAPTEPRNIVLCFDGTGDWAGTDTTNVMKIHERLHPDNQLIYYEGGVGTLGSPIALNPFQRTFLKLLDLASATSLRDNVLAGYTFLVENYQGPQEGKLADQIFMFGFSRGAFTARLLASLIYNFGLLDLEHKNLAPYLWQTISEFRNFDDFLKDAAMIRRCFARREEVKIHFLGLFDTVSSVGIFERFKIYPYTDKNPVVDYVRHAVSIDEQRNAFPELLAEPAKHELTGQMNDVREIWFHGVHRDVGGGAADHPGLSNETLNWMITEASSKGLRLDEELAPVNDKAIHGSVFDPYAFVGLYTMKMFDPALKRLPIRDPGFRWFWPNFRHERVIPQDAYIYDGGGKSHRNDAPKVSVNLDDVPEKEEPPQYKPIAANVPDAIGILLGVTLAVLMLVRGVGEPLMRQIDAGLLRNWSAWPTPSGSLWISSVVLWIFAAFVVHQGFYAAIAKKAAWLNLVIQGGFVVWALLIGRHYVAVNAGAHSGWSSFYAALAIGVLVMFISLIGPKPVMPAVRAIGYFMVPWILIIIGYWIVAWLLSIAKPYLDVALSFLLGGSHVTLVFDPYLIYFAAAAVVALGVLGLGSIVKDRLAERPFTEKKNSEDAKDLKGWEDWQDDDTSQLLDTVVDIASKNVDRALLYFTYGLMLLAVGLLLVFRHEAPEWMYRIAPGRDVLALPACQFIFVALGVIYLARFGLKVKAAFSERKALKKLLADSVPVGDVMGESKASPAKQQVMVDSRLAPAASAPVTDILNTAEDLNTHTIAAVLSLCGGLFVVAMILGGLVWLLWALSFVVGFGWIIKGPPKDVETALYKRRIQLKASFFRSAPKKVT